MSRSPDRTSNYGIPLDSQDPGGTEDAPRPSRARLAHERSLAILARLVDDEEEEEEQPEQQSEQQHAPATFRAPSSASVRRPGPTTQAGSNQTGTRGQAPSRAAPSAQQQPFAPGPVPAGPERPARRGRNPVARQPLAPEGSRAFSRDESPERDELPAMQRQPSPIREDPEPLLDDDNNDEFGIVDVGAIPGQESIDHARYAVLARNLQTDGWLPLLKSAYEDEMSTDSTFSRGITYHTWANGADDVLASMEQRAIVEACAGNLAKAYDLSKAAKTLFSSRLDRNQERADEHPSIYIRIFCEKETGDALTIQRAESLIRHARAYANQDSSYNDSAYKIDRAFDRKHKWQREMTDDGGRWFLMTKGSKISSQRKRVILTFAHTLERLVNECREKGETHAPLMQYIGYALRASQHSKQDDESFSSTNWLCMFVQAFAEAYWPGEYVMRTFTICLITEECIGPIAEMLLTRLTRSYYHAGGFSIDQAGKSMRSIRMEKLSDAERSEVWGDCQEWVHRHTNYTHAMRQEFDRRKELQQRETSLRIKAKMDENSEILEEERDFERTTDREALLLAQFDLTEGPPPKFLNLLLERQAIAKRSREVREKLGLE